MPWRSSRRRQGGVRSIVVPLVGERASAQHLLGGEGDHLLGQLHHLQVVGIGPVELELGELGVMGAVDAFVAEVAPDLVDALQVAHQQAFEVQLERDAQVQVLLELVVVGDERARRRAAVDAAAGRAFRLPGSRARPGTRAGRGRSRRGCGRSGAHPG